MTDLLFKNFLLQTTRGKAIAERARIQSKVIYYAKLISGTA